MNIGHSSRTIYDKCAYDDRLQESVGPLMYRLNPNQMNNCEGCLSTFGPRAGHNGVGVSTVKTNSIAPAQELVDIDSILSNRNVLQSKCKDGRVNDVDVTKFTLQHARNCNDFLDPSSSRLTNPAANYRGMSINRFHDLPKNAQENIFWDHSINTQLEARDNFRERVPDLMNDLSHPKESTGKQCKYTCSTNCPKNCGCGKKSNK